MEEKEILNVLYNVKIDSIARLYAHCEAKAGAAKRLLDRKVDKIDSELLEANRKAVNEKNNKLKSDISQEFTAFIRSLGATDKSTIIIDIKYKITNVINSYLKNRVNNDDNTDIKDFACEIYNQAINHIESRFDRLDHQNKEITLEKDRLEQRCVSYEELLKTQKASNDQLYEETKAMYEDKLKMQNNLYQNNIKSLETQVADLHKQNNNYIQTILKLEEKESKQREKSKSKNKMSSDMQSILEELREITTENVEDRVKILADKEIVLKEREYERRINEIKQQYEKDINLVKQLYEKRLDEARTEIAELKNSNYHHQTKLLKKETEIKIMGEQLKNEQNNRKTHNEFSKVLGSVG